MASAPMLGAVSQAAVPVPGNPFAAVATADGRWSFVTLNSADSDRFSAKGATVNLAVVNVRAALAGRPAPSPGR